MSPTGRTLDRTTAILWLVVGDVDVTWITKHWDVLVDGVRAVTLAGTAAVAFL